MKVEHKIVIVMMALLCCNFLSAQMDKYGFKRSLNNIHSLWCRVELPDQVYGRLQSGFNDLRIYSINSVNKDTLEMPYFISDDLIMEEQKQKFQIINQSQIGTVYYFTLRAEKAMISNRIHLNFEQTNFDWRLKLEGSHDQKEWFILKENYRLLSIRNEFTEYQFCTVEFPESDFTYYRVAIEANEKPLIKETTVTRKEQPVVSMKKYRIRSSRVITDKIKQQTIIELNLYMQVPVNQIKLKVSDTVDFYRPLTVEYLTDSFHTENGWYYNYEPALKNSTISSLEDSQTFRFPRCITKQLRITIENNDNQVIDFKGFEVSGLPVSLIARINSAGSCWLCYGLKDAAVPEYDLLNFGEKIPLLKANVSVGEEEVLCAEVNDTVQPLFENKLWLWLTMGIIMLLLIVFSVKMFSKF